MIKNTDETVRDSNGRFSIGSVRTLLSKNDISIKTFFVLIKLDFT